jgi:hypothetical protein
MVRNEDSNKRRKPLFLAPLLKCRNSMYPETYPRERGMSVARTHAIGATASIGRSMTLSPRGQRRNP